MDFGVVQMGVIILCDIFYKNYCKVQPISGYADTAAYAYPDSISIPVVDSRILCTTY